MKPVGIVLVEAIPFGIVCSLYVISMFLDWQKLYKRVSDKSRLELRIGPMRSYRHYYEADVKRESLNDKLDLTHHPGVKMFMDIIFYLQWASIGGLAISPFLVFTGLPFIYRYAWMLLTGISCILSFVYCNLFTIAIQVDDVLDQIDKKVNGTIEFDGGEGAGLWIAYAAKALTILLLVYALWLQQSACGCSNVSFA